MGSFVAITEDDTSFSTSLFLIGGLDSNSNADNVVQAYDLPSDSWEFKTGMPVNRYGSGGVYYDGTIYVIGGVGFDYAVHDDVLAYDVETDSWDDTLSNYPVNVEFERVEEVGGKLYSFGGDPGDTSTPYNNAYVYDPASDAWTQLTDLPQARTRMASFVIDGSVYVCGGDFEQREAWRYDPSSDTYTSLSDMPVYDDAAASDLSGHVNPKTGLGWVFARDNAFYYTPSTDTWQATGTAPPVNHVGRVVEFMEDEYFHSFSWDLADHYRYQPSSQTADLTPTDPPSELNYPTGGGSR